MGQTVNLLSFDFGGSNPSAPTFLPKDGIFWNCFTLGEMVEWSITAVLKTAVPRGTGGSNPSLSADNN